MKTLAGVKFRKYRDADLAAVQRLVRDVFTEFVMPDATSDGKIWWTDFHSMGNENIARIQRRFAECPIRYIAVDGRRIVGTVMGTVAELKRIFVRPSHHRRGIGRRLMELFENDCRKFGARRYRIISGLFAVPFYERMGCRKSTGVRVIHGLKVQPMKRVLRV
jgi:GNAT superfamily N-acetyltransferase